MLFSLVRLFLEAPVSITKFTSLEPITVTTSNSCGLSVCSSNSHYEFSEARLASKHGLEEGITVQRDLFGLLHHDLQLLCVV